MSNFEEIKKYMEWRTRKRRKWYLFGLGITVYILGLIGLVVLTNPIFSPPSLPWIGRLGVIVLGMTWTVGGVVGLLFLGNWASKDKK